MSSSGPRILIIGGTYRALCTLERLLERGDHVVAFIGVEGGGERDFCPEILEICDRHQIPARSGHKLGEEIVRWLDDRIRPELALAVGVKTEIPLAVGGNCRLGLLEAIDCFLSDSCPGLVLRQRGQDVHQREFALAEDEDAGDAYLRMVEQLVDAIEHQLDALAPAQRKPAPRVPFEPEPPACEADGLARVTARPDPGEETRRLEAEVADYVGAEHVFALRDPLQAFQLLGRALALGPEAGALLPGVCSAAARDGLAAAGAALAHADVVPGRLTLDPELARDALGPRVRALVLSHPLGQPAPLATLYVLAAEHELEVLEDAGGALGARFGDARLGKSPCACVFQVPLRGLAGAHAALVTLPASLAERVAPELGPLRLGDGAAALLRRELETLEDRLSARRANALAYSAELARYDAFQVPPTPENALTSYAGYLLKLTRFARTSADDLHKLLLEAGLETRRMKLPLRERDLALLPQSEQARATGLLLPIEPGLTDGQRDHLLDAIFSYAIG